MEGKPPTSVAAPHAAAALLLSPPPSSSERIRCSSNKNYWKNDNQFKRHLEEQLNQYMCLIDVIVYMIVLVSFFQTADYFRVDCLTMLSYTCVMF